uniref:Akirin n=1 Tax=Steinernema glaseri TaxID=37863 RepID=A0A1I8AT04_9BILA
MTCGLALKRPFDFETYLSADGPSQAKRQRQSPHCSPFRPQLGTIAASLPTSSTLKVLHQDESDDSPFATVNGGKLTSAQLESYLRAEVRSLRRRKLIPRRRVESGSGHVDQNKPSTSYRAVSPVNSGSSDSEGESNHRRENITRSARHMSPTESDDLYEKPQFSLKQVQLICERLLQEQEVRLRYEYENVLSTQLSEQHEQYVTFVQEQIKASSTNHNATTYVS